MQYVQFKKASIRQALAGAFVIASFLLTGPVHSQSFPPFPEPAVGPFPDTENMRLLDQLLPAEIGAVTPRSGVLLNDIWGWTSPMGEEYALVGTGDGMSIVRVTDPDNPVFIGIMPTPEPDDFANLWGDVGVYNVGQPRRDNDSGDDGDGAGRHFPWYTGYAYFTTEAGGAGISILDLSQLDHFGPAPHDGFQIPPSAVFDAGGYNSAHNIYVNQDTGFAYVVGAELTDGTTACDGHPFHPSRFNTMILDLKPDPLNPQIVSCLADFGEHDIYVVNYNGPDRDYRGREIAFVFDGRDKDTASRGGMRVDDTPGELGGGTTEIWDVTDKSDIKVISSFTVPGICFSHQGWTSSNRHDFLLINDELDELRDAEDENGFFRNNFCATDNPPGTTSNPGIYVVDVRDLDNPIFQERFSVESPGDNDHNFIREGNKLYWAVYNTGTRVLQISRQGRDLKLQEIARLDSEPRDAPAFNGQWGIFPFPHSRTIIASDIVNGLMVMRLDRSRGDEMKSTKALSAPNAAAIARQRASTRSALTEYYRSRIR
jgi:choice-of-anchor B domain-containing protein